MGSEEQLLNEWFNGEKAKGLVDFKVTLDPFVDPKITREQLCKDINDFNKAIAEGKTKPINWKELEG
jgi:hypothetical protein